MWLAVLRFFLGLLGYVPKGPSADEKLGTAEQALATDQQALADVATAQQVARADAAVVAADPSSLRDPSPDSRD